jgi:hypothetical protein
MGLKFIGTRRVRQIGQEGRKSTILYIDKDWGFCAGEVIKFTIRRLSDESEEAGHQALKRLSLSGSSYRVVLNKKWEYQEGEWVVYTVEYPDDA